MPRGSNFQKPYPPEFRREAVALYRRGGATLREVASDLGVSSESLRMWVKQSAIDAGKTNGLTTPSRRDEVDTIGRPAEAAVGKPALDPA